MKKRIGTQMLGGAQISPLYLVDVNDKSHTPAEITSGREFRCMVDSMDLRIILDMVVNRRFATHCSRM